MFSEDFRLPDPWENYLQHIERTSANFWERERRYKDYVRLQNIKIWRELRSWLLTIESGLVDKDHQLTAFETFLLHAATYLYEIGFQEVDVRQSGLTEGYIASGRRILKCRMPDRGETDFGLSSLDDSTISILAKLCAAVGTLDLPSLKLSSRPEPGGFGQMVRLRYLIALLQLADLLFVKDRANEGVLYSLSPLDTANLADARLALQGYISGVDLQKEGLTLYLKIHLSDEYLDKKMYALFVEPLRVWWSYNWK